MTEAAAFEGQRRRLTGLAYRMLGSRAEAEDVVQDAYLRWHEVDKDEVADPARFLGTVVTRLCLDRLKSARARREIYVGPWLPEPLVDEGFGESGEGAFAEDLSMALMLTLERLSPLERAAFLLHDVFELDFAEIARTLGRGEAACRKLASRARENLRANRPRFAASAEEGRTLAEAFLKSAETADPGPLMAVLATDAVLYTDGGGRKIAALNPIFGAMNILRFFAGIARKNEAVRLSRYRPARINGLPGFVIEEPDGSVATMAFEPRDGMIGAIYVVRNPDKLRHVRF